jgi:hypothetical protein
MEVRHAVALGVQPVADHGFDVLVGADIEQHRAGIPDQAVGPAVTRLRTALSQATWTAIIARRMALENAARSPNLPVPKAKRELPAC